MDRLTTRLFLFLVIIESSVVVLLSLIDFFEFTLAISILLVAVAYQIKSLLTKPEKKKIKPVENTVKSTSMNNTREKT